MQTARLGEGDLGCVSSPAPPRGWFSGLELLWPQGTPPASLSETGCVDLEPAWISVFGLRALPLQEATGSHTPALPRPAPWVTPVGTLCRGCFLQAAGRLLGATPGPS